LEIVWQPYIFRFINDCIKLTSGFPISYGIFSNTYDGLLVKQIGSRRYF